MGVAAVAKFDERPLLEEQKTQGAGRGALRYFRDVTLFENQSAS